MKSAFLLAGVWFALLNSTIAESNAPDPIAASACMRAALAAYNEAVVDLDKSSQPLMSIETKIVQRRLKERFCLSLVTCRFGEPTPSNDLPIRAEFSSCVDEK